MTTEHTSSDKRWAQNGNAVSVRGWRHVHALANMEGLLMGIAAAQRIRGYLTPSDLNQIAFIGFEFVRSGYRNVLAMSPSCTILAESVESLGLQLDESQWIWAVDYESGAWQVEREDSAYRIYGGDFCLEGKEYRSVPHRGNTDASVYIPVQVSENACFEVIELDTDKTLAILATMRIARSIANYAVTEHGGYGDLLIRETSSRPTHSGFNAWLID